MKTVKYRYKIINKYHILVLLFSIVVVFNCRGFNFLLPERMQYLYLCIYKICTLCCIASFFSKKIKINVYRELIIYCSSLVFLFLLPEFIYTSMIYHQKLKDFIFAIDCYLFVFWSLPVMYIFCKDNSIEPFLNLMAMLVTIGFLSLIINVYFKNNFNFSFFNMKRWEFREGTIRIVDTSSFAAVVLLFYWKKILEGRKNYIIPCIILVLGYLYVDRTRAAMIALSASMYFMLIVKKSGTLSKCFWTFITFLGIFLMFEFHVIENLLYQFSPENNGASTINRLEELKFYWGKFLENKLFGIGTLTSENLYSAMNISAVGNMNYQDIGIVGLLGVIGGIGTLLVFIIPIIRWIKILFKMYNREKCSSDFIFLSGILLYIIATSPTLIIINYQRMPLYPICIALYEFYYYKIKLETRKTRWTVNIKESSDLQRCCY